MLLYNLYIETAEFPEADFDDSFLVSADERGAGRNASEHGLTDISPHATQTSSNATQSSNQPDFDTSSKSVESASCTQHAAQQQTAARYVTYQIRVTEQQLNFHVVFTRFINRLPIGHMYKMTID